MSKTVDFEIATSMEIIEPEGFMPAVLTMGSQIFNPPLKRGYYIVDENNLGSRPKEQRFRTVSDVRTRFIHFNRAAEPYGSLGAEFIKLATTIDPRFQDEELIGGIDLHKEVASRLFGRLGECSIRGLSFEFDYVVDVTSQRDPSRRLFVLKQLPAVATKQEQVIRPLDVITECVCKVVEKTAPTIYKLSSDSHTVEGGLLIGYTTDLNDDRIQLFKDRLTDMFAEDPIVARAGVLEITTQT